MKAQTEMLLNAANNLDNGKPLIIPQPLMNPKEIAAMVIQKQQKEMLIRQKNQA